MDTCSVVSIPPDPPVKFVRDPHGVVHSDPYDGCVDCEERILNPSEWVDVPDGVPISCLACLGARDEASHFGWIVRRLTRDTDSASKAVSAQPFVGLR